MFACFCLNILIETGPASDFQKVNLESLNLSETEKNDDFFKQEFLRVGKLINIGKVHPSIVQSRNLESWIVTRCANCECHSHAVHRESGASFVLVYKNLLDSEAIANLKVSDAFSPIFKIVINPPNSDIAEDINLDAFKSREVEASIRDLRVMMDEYIKKETLDVANKLEQYKKHLYEEYDKKKERAYKEEGHLETVVQLAYNQMRRENISGKMADAAATPQRLERLADEALPSSFNRLLLSNGHSPRHGSPTNMPRPPKSLDAMGVFDFEGTDEAPSLSSTDHDDSDGEGGVKDPDELFVPRAVIRGPRREIAQSLPMNIPAFMQARRLSTEDMEDVPQGEYVNIPESIRALAQSVHGDAVFGDLPRPRFSNQ